MEKRPDSIERFIRMCSDGWKMGWHECHGGNLTYRMKEEEIQEIENDIPSPWIPLGQTLKNLANECFLVTGSGKSMRNAEIYPKETFGIVRVSENGDSYRIIWGLENGGRPTSELPAHLMCQSVKKEVTKGKHRIVYHAHPANVIALSFVLPLKDEIFTRELWEMEPECAMIFPNGMGVLPWMVPGTKEIAELTCEKMKEYDVVLWAQHGLFVTGETFDEAFGLMNTVEKGAEILVRVLSMTPVKRQTPSVENFREMGEIFHLHLPEKFLYQKG